MIIILHIITPVICIVGREGNIQREHQIFKFLLTSREIECHCTTYISSLLFLVRNRHDSIKSVCIRIKALSNIKVIETFDCCITIGFKTSTCCLLAFQYLIQSGQPLLSIQHKPFRNNVIFRLYSFKLTVLKANMFATISQKHSGSHRKA